MVNVDIHSYRATGLTPDTEYTFKVVAVDKDGKELGTAKEISQKTTVKPEEFNIFRLWCSGNRRLQLLIMMKSMHL